MVNCYSALYKIYQDIPPIRSQFNTSVSSRLFFPPLVLDRIYTQQCCISIYFLVWFAPSFLSISYTIEHWIDFGGWSKQKNVNQNEHYLLILTIEKLLQSFVFFSQDDDKTFPVIITKSWPFFHSSRAGLIADFPLFPSRLCSRTLLFVLPSLSMAIPISLLIFLRSLAALSVRCLCIHWMPSSLFRLLNGK